MQLMPADLAAWPNELVSVPCSHCSKQVDIEPLTILSMAEFKELEKDLRIDATEKCGCSNKEK